MRRHPPGCALLAAVLGITLVACNGTPGSGDRDGDGVTLAIDGEAGAWQVQPGDAVFRRHGVATGLALRAKDGGRMVELSATFLGEPANPVFVALKVSYDDGAGQLFERVPQLATDDQRDESVAWERIAIDHDKGVGFARVALDIPVCVDHYTSPTESETRCHQLAGRFDAALVHDSTLRIMQ